MDKTSCEGGRMARCGTTTLPREPGRQGVPPQGNCECQHNCIKPLNSNYSHPWQLISEPGGSSVVGWFGKGCGQSDESFRPEAPSCSNDKENTSEKRGRNSPFIYGSEHGPSTPVISCITSV